MTQPAGHPPFAKPAKGTPMDALPFGRRMCEHLAAALVGAGPKAHDGILRLAMIPMDEHCRSVEIDAGDGVVVSVFRSIVGPAPLSLRFSARTFLAGRGMNNVSYADGTLSLRYDVPHSVIGSLVGRRVTDVADLPARFPGSRARIVRASDNGYGSLVLGLEHRKTHITYADLAGPLPIAA